MSNAAQRQTHPQNALMHESVSPRKHHLELFQSFANEFPEHYRPLAILLAMKSNKKISVVVGQKPGVGRRIIVSKRPIYTEKTRLLSLSIHASTAEGDKLISLCWLMEKSVKGSAPTCLLSGSLGSLLPWKRQWKTSATVDWNAEGRSKLIS